MRSRLFPLVLALLAGCTSSAPEPPTGLHEGGVLDLQRYKKVNPSTVFAFGYGDVDGYEGKDDHPVSVVFRVEPGFARYRLLEAPIEADGGDLGAFRVSATPFQALLGGALGVFVTDMDEDRYQYRVVAERAGELFASDPIPSRIDAAHTVYAPGAMKFEPSANRFSWDSAPAAPTYVVGVTDERSTFCGGAATNVPMWIYGELVGAVDYFQPAGGERDLIPGRRYRALLFSIGTDRWAISLTDLAFER